jgi:hypothetical protein
MGEDFLQILPTALCYHGLLSKQLVVCEEDIDDQLMKFCLH